MKIGIIDYGAGNVQSVKFAIERLGYSAELYADVALLETCDKIIFPGVGHAKPAMAKLRERNLDTFILNCKKPLLGICLGMQLLCRHSEEGDTDCIGVFDVDVLKFKLSDLKIPHVGWNNVKKVSSALFQNKEMENAFVYFVHSYYVPQNNYSIANCTYGIEFAAALKKDNFYATQFHPEKSGIVGENILKCFLDL
jgi:glutamine amidotransferase